MSKKPSGPAIFMYAVITITAITSVICFTLYYGNFSENGNILWTGIVAFMIMYHFWLRIIMGNVTKLFKIDKNHFWFRERFFEKRLYRMLMVKKWKGKALTYDPDAFSLKKHSLEEIADVMTKSEVDHWVNEVISLTSILFSVLWGQFYIFLATAIIAMIFDGQFIVIQRYNRPRVLKVIEFRKRAKKQIV